MTTIINIPRLCVFYALCLVGIVAGLTTTSPSPAIAAPFGVESSATDAVKGTIDELIQVLDDETLKQPE